MIAIHQTPKAACPACETMLSAGAGGTPIRGPQPGDMNICIHCGAVLNYENDMSLRLLSREEIDALDHEMRNQVLVISREIKHARSHLN